MSVSIATQKSSVLFLTLVAGGITLLLAGIVPGLSALLIAIIIGAIVGNLRVVPRAANPAISWGSKKLLRIGIVLLGFKLSLISLGEVGFRGVLVLVITVAVTFTGTILVGRLLKLPRITQLLVATGFSICGASAVAAMSSVIDRDAEHEEETAQAVALVTIFGTILMFCLPPLARILSLTDLQAGLWVGASVHEVAQVVAAGGFISAAALTLATVAKLGRVVLLAPLIGIWSVVESRSTVSQTTTSARKPPLLPLFVAGFLLAVLARTFIPIPESLLSVLDFSTNLLLASAMLGLGFGVDIRKMIATGWKPVVLGLISTLIATGVSIALILGLQVT
ncbi:MAG: YeiH family protein [Leucobacter sp.]